MKLVIDIPEEMYKDIKSGKDGYSNYVHTAIRNGTPLPTDSVNRMTIKEYLDSYNDVPETNVGKIGKETTTSELSSIRHELLERKDELVSFGQLIERFDDVDAEYGGSPWTLEQIYANFNILIGIESVESPSYNGVKTELEPFEDCISRKDVLEEINRVGVKGFETYNDYSQLYDFVDTLPSVITPQPKIGKWIYNKEEDSYRCSLCNFPCHKDNMGAIPTTYCAECGAKMEM